MEGACANDWQQTLSEHPHHVANILRNTLGNTNVPSQLQTQIMDGICNQNLTGDALGNFVRSVAADGGGMGGAGGNMGGNIGGNMGGNMGGNPFGQQQQPQPQRQQQYGQQTNRGVVIKDPASLALLQLAQYQRNDDSRFRNQIFMGEMSEADQMAVQRGTDELSNPEEFKHMKYISMAYGGLVFIIACIVGYFVFKSIYLNLISDTSQDVQDAVTTINMYQALGIGITIIVAIALFKFYFSKVHAEEKRKYLKPVRYEAGRTAAYRDLTLMPGVERDKIERKQRDNEDRKIKFEKEKNEEKHAQEVAKQKAEREYKDAEKAKEREHDLLKSDKERAHKVEDKDKDREHALEKQRQRLEWAQKNPDAAKHIRLDT